MRESAGGIMLKLEFGQLLLVLLVVLRLFGELEITVRLRRSDTQRE